MTWLRALQSRLITRFSTKQNLLSADRSITLDRTALTPQFLVGRDFSQFSCIDLSHVPSAKRMQALVQQIKLLSPWDDTKFSVAWADGIAQVWFWSEGEVSALLNQDSVSSILYRPEFFSETVFWEKPLSEGLHLYKAHTGFDLQFWRGGLLTASQWFAAIPSAQQLQRFVRANGLSAQPNNLPVLEPQLTRKAWDGVVFSLWGHLFDRRAQILIYVMALSILIATMQATSIARWQIESSKLQQKTAELSKSAEPFLSARSSARAAKQELQKHYELMFAASPLSSQLLVQRALPKNLKLELQTWERNVDQVDLQVRGAIPDTLSVVRALEAAGFKEVRVEPVADNSQYRIRLRLSSELAFAVKARNKS